MGPLMCNESKEEKDRHHIQLLIGLLSMTL